MVLGYIMTCSDFPFYPDDDYYLVNPVLPFKGESDNDSTTIIACAATAMVAA